MSWQRDACTQGSGICFKLSIKIKYSPGEKIRTVLALAGWGQRLEGTEGEEATQPLFPIAWVQRKGLGGWTQNPELGCAPPRPPGDPGIPSPPRPGILRCSSEWAAHVWSGGRGDSPLLWGGKGEPLVVEE